MGSEKVRSATEMMSNPFASVFKDPKNRRSGAGPSRKSVFSVLEELSDTEKDKLGANIGGEL